MSDLIERLRLFSAGKLRFGDDPSSPFRAMEEAANEIERLRVIPAGWKLVPAEPTAEMVNALYDALDDLQVVPARAGEEKDIAEAIRRMFASAP